MHCEPSFNSRAALQSLPDGVLIVDAQGRIVYLNPAATRLLELDVDAVLGNTIAAVPELGALHIYTAGQRGQLARDARIIRFEVVPVAGEPDARMFVLREATAKEREEQELCSFISIASHDIRPLYTIIRGDIDLLLRHSDIGPLNDEQRRILTDAQHFVTVQSKAVAQMFIFFDFIFGFISLERETFDPRNIMSEVIRYLMPQFIDRNITFNAIIDEQVPLIYADPILFRELIRMLLEDTLHRFYNIQDVELQVRIDTNDVHFDFHARGGSSDSCWEWTIGAKTIRKTADFQGARWRVEHHEGQGSTFSFTLPVAGANAAH